MFEKFEVVWPIDHSVSGTFSDCEYQFEPLSSFDPEQDQDLDALTVQVIGHSSPDAAKTFLEQPTVCGSESTRPLDVDADAGCLGLPETESHFYATACIQQASWTACMSIQPNPAGAAELDQTITQLTELAELAAERLPTS